MKKLAVVLAALLCLSGFTRGSLVSIVAPPITNSFTTLRTGGGGLAVGVDISPTGVRFLRGDVWSGWVWTTNLDNCGPQAVTGCWYDLISSASMPAANF